MFPAGEGGGVLGSCLSTQTSQTLVLRPQEEEAGSCAASSRGRLSQSPFGGVRKRGGVAGSCFSCRLRRNTNPPLPDLEKRVPLTHWQAFIFALGYGAFINQSALVVLDTRKSPEEHQ